MLILLFISYLDTIKNVISSETSSGGLSEKAYYIEDVPTLNVEALELLSNNNISNSLNDWKDSVLSDLKVQRTKELKKLLDEIDKKIKSINSEIASLSRKISSAAEGEDVSSIRKNIQYIV